MSKRRRSPSSRLVGEIELDADKKAVFPLALDLQCMTEYLQVEDFPFYHFIAIEPYRNDLEIKVVIIYGVLKRESGAMFITLIGNFFCTLGSFQKYPITLYYLSDSERSVS